MLQISSETSSEIGQYSVQKHRTTEIQQNLLELSVHTLFYHPNRRACLQDKCFKCPSNFVITCNES